MNGNTRTLIAAYFCCAANSIAFCRSAALIPGRAAFTACCPKSLSRFMVFLSMVFLSVVNLVWPGHEKALPVQGRANIGG